VRQVAVLAFGCLHTLPVLSVTSQLGAEIRVDSCDDTYGAVEATSGETAAFRAASETELLRTVLRMPQQASAADDRLAAE
jgi:hypothetical protein